MRTITSLFTALILGSAAHGQTVATFEDLTLPATDTFYINISNSGNDVGFTDGLARFPCVYDTAGGYTTWNYFAYSNKTDSVTSGYTNQYAAKTQTGYNGSSKYAVAYCANTVVFNQYTMNLNLTGAAIGHSVDGFFVTNSTYAYNSMRDGDMFAHKFHDGDWFLLTVKGYAGGALTTDSVNFYLADFRFPDSSMNYIVKTWDWVSLLPLGDVDSLQFEMRSSDTGGGYINTPTYFCMDNFTTNETSVSVKNVAQPALVKVYPNPANDVLFVDIPGSAVQQITITDATGQIMGNYAVKQAQTTINISSLPAGVYVLGLMINGKAVNSKFIKM